jgi:autotransporter-associated beta strand protein
VFSDERINFPTNYLHQGQNTITLNMRKGGSLDNHAMYDYIRLELTGYVPPPPASVAAYAGNNCNLISWPVTPGATSYNILRSTTSGSGYVSITNGVVGPVCGSGWNNATYLDAGAANGTAYYYVVQSANPTGASTNSPQSSGATPSGALSTSVPAAPAGLAVTSVGHQSVTLNWTASPGANFYTVYRSTLVDTLGGASNTLSTIVLNNTNTGTSYTDISPTDGSIYNYFVTATSAGGTSGSSTSAVGVPLPAPPASAPGSLTGRFVQTTNITLNWSAVSGAVGYIIRLATSASGPFTYVDNITETTYTDVGLTPGAYYYEVAAVNAAGVSANALVTVIAPPAAPTSLSAVPDDSQVTLTWSAVANATSYILKSGASSGNETTTVISGYTGTSYTNTGLANGTTYYYVVAATNAGGLGPNSPEASATPSVNIVITARNLVWKGDGSANIWDVSGASNWKSNATVTIFNNGDAATFDNSGSNNVAVTLVGTPQPALVTFNATKNYTFSGGGSITGTNVLLKSGTGALTINTTNTYSGGTVISNGSIVIGNIGANSAAWGTGPIYFYGGTVQFNGYGGSTGTGWGGCTNALVVPAGQTGTLQLPPRWGYSSPFTSPLTGGGTLNVTVEYVRDYFSGDWSAFTGQINVSSVPDGDTTGDFRINNVNGYANAAFYLTNGVNLYTINNNSLTVDLGELGGASGAFIGAGSGSATNPTWRIGAKNTTNTYAGVIADAGVTSLIKTGAGTFILTGVSNSYSGGTTINGGTLLLNNTNGSGTGSGAVTVAGGGTLGGAGIISGTVTVNSGGALAPGNPLGTLTISNNLTLAAGSTTFAQVQHLPLTNNAVKITSTLFEGGTLNVTNIGLATLTDGDSFKLFSAAGYSGSFAGFVLPPLGTNLAWNTTTLHSNGVISVVTLTPPTISGVRVMNGNLVFSGTGAPANWTYCVLSSTDVSLPLAQWTCVATNQTDGGGNIAVTVTNGVDPNLPQRFLILQLQ